MNQFNAQRAIEAAEAVVRSTRTTIAPPRRWARKPPPPDVTLENRPISCALTAPRWTFFMLAAAAPLWLRAAFWCIAAIATFGALIGALTVIGLAMMAREFFSH